MQVTCCILSLSFAAFAALNGMFGVRLLTVLLFLYFLFADKLTDERHCVEMKLAEHFFYLKNLMPKSRLMSLFLIPRSSVWSFFNPASLAASNCSNSASNRPTSTHNHTQREGVIARRSPLFFASSFARLICHQSRPSLSHSSSLSTAAFFLLFIYFLFRFCLQKNEGS